MTETVGRAGFNVRHLRHGESGTRADRASILRESMREFDPEASAFYAKHNPNIVANDTRLNVAMVNDGAGGFRRALSTEEVLAYGDARIGTKRNEKGEDRVGDTGRKWNPRSFETTLLVAALPRTMCVEVPDVYPVVHAKGKDKGEPVLDVNGEPVMRSRWVARDRDEALRYFAETAAFLSESVLSGGHDAMHGYDVNFDESYPHMQLMADTLAEDPKHPGELRVEAQQMWGAHREVIDPATGKVEQGKAKITRYQQAYREHMHGLGYDVELDASERSKSSHTREEWAEFQESRREDDELYRRRVAGYEAAKTKLANRDRALNARESNVEQQKRDAVQQGLAEGRGLARQELADALLAAQRAQDRAEAADAAAHAERARLRRAREKAEGRREAFAEGYRDLDELARQKLWDGRTVGEARLKIAQGVKNVIQSHDSAPDTSGSDKGVRGPETGL